MCTYYSLTPFLYCCSPPSTACSISSCPATCCPTSCCPPPVCPPPKIIFLTALKKPEVKKKKRRRRRRRQKSKRTCTPRNPCGPNGAQTDMSNFGRTSSWGGSGMRRSFGSAGMAGIGSPAMGSFRGSVPGFGGPGMGQGSLMGSGVGGPGALPGGPMVGPGGAAGSFGGMPGGPGNLGAPGSVMAGNLGPGGSLGPGGAAGPGGSAMGGPGGSALGGQNVGGGKSSFGPPPGVYGNGDGAYNKAFGCTMKKVCTCVKPSLPPPCPPPQKKKCTCGIQVTPPPPRPEGCICVRSSSQCAPAAEPIAQRYSPVQCPPPRRCTCGRPAIPRSSFSYFQEPTVNQIYGVSPKLSFNNYNLPTFNQTAATMMSFDTFNNCNANRFCDPPQQYSASSYSCICGPRSLQDISYDCSSYYPNSRLDKCRALYY